MARDAILKSWPFSMVGHPLFAVLAQLISYGFVWVLVRDWRYAFVLWAGIRVFALWVNLIQNYWTHDRRFGTRRYDDPGDNAMNIGEWLPVMATFSACLQNNHHHYPHLLRLSHADDGVRLRLHDREGHGRARAGHALEDGNGKTFGPGGFTAHPLEGLSEHSSVAAYRPMNGSMNCLKKPGRTDVPLKP